MSLYYESATILQNAENAGGSLKNRIYGKKDLKSPPATIFAVVSEASKWSAVLKDVVEKSDILRLEKKLTPTLAILLAHDLLLSKRGVAAPASHPLKLAITRHKARLSAELTKLRIKRGFSTLDAFRQHINAAALDGDDGSANGAPPHPRWVRINTIRTSLSAQLSTTFADWAQKPSLADVMAASGSSKVLHVDAHIPNLIAIPPRADLSKSKAYQSGDIIFQDKASCFPAYLLDAAPSDGSIIDACAAPGNKTTHLAAIATEKAKASASSSKFTQRITACERDKRRATILSKMVGLAGADTIVSTRGGQDFMRLKPGAADMADVGALLLDPSCSGSGIVGRDDAIKLVLPAAASGAAASMNPSKKRKRKNTAVAAAEPVVQKEEVEEEIRENEEEGVGAGAGSESLKTRLENLSGFQLKLLCHAMAFPNARKITYSTCSVHAEENEHVVVRALASDVAVQQGWRVLRREEQVEGMRKWDVRGVRDSCVVEGVEIDEEEKEVVADACIRCEKGTVEGTMGFFVAGFVRDHVEGGGGEDGAVGPEDVEDDEWNGFSDDGAA